jgi:hypothetical protein
MIDPRLSSLGNEILAPIAARKPSGRTSPLTAPDLKTLNTQADNRISVDELKGALARQRGVAAENLTFLPEEEAALAEDARDLTSLLRRGGGLEGSRETGFTYVAPNKTFTLADLRNADAHENLIALQPGTDSADIRQIRTLLNNLHSLDENYKPLDERSTQYDEELSCALQDFQHKYNLTALEGVRPGVLDNRTLKALEREVEGVIKQQDIYNPYIPIEDMPGVPDQDPRRLETLHKISDQLAARGLTAPEIEQAFSTGHQLAGFAEQAIREVEAKVKGGSQGFCYTGVKEAMEGSLNLRYQTFGGKGGSWASTADDNIFRKRPDLFAELKLSREELNYLPTGAIVVYEPGGVGHIGIKGYNAEGKQLDISDRIRTGRPYPNANYKVFIPLKAVESGDRHFASPAEAQDLSRLEYAARRSRARR